MTGPYSGDIKTASVDLDHIAHLIDCLMPGVQTSRYIALAYFLDMARNEARSLQKAAKSASKASKQHKGTELDSCP